MPFSRGLSLAEILISMGLLAGIGLSMNMFMLKANTTLSSLSTRNRGVTEIGTLFQRIRQNIRRTTRIDQTSFDKKLLINVLDDTGIARDVRYQITAGNILQTSTDGGVTWGSPYSVAADTTYTLGGGQFLYCGTTNNCTSFQDTNANGIYEPGVDAAGTVSAPYSGTPLTSPKQASRVVLSGFVFNRAGGQPDHIADHAHRHRPGAGSPGLDHGWSLAGFLHQRSHHNFQHHL